VDIVRVISGTAKGHKLKTVKGITTRPTSDRVKESLFNIITPFIMDSEVLDLFAGTGSLGIEALSRGARLAVLVDKSRECCDIIKENLVHTKLQEKCTVYNADFVDIVARMAGEGRKFDIILLDPPYNKNFIQEMLKILMKNDIIRNNGILIAEHRIDDTLPESEGMLKIADKRVFGDTVLSIYRKGR